MVVFVDEDAIDSAICHHFFTKLSMPKINSNRILLFGAIPLIIMFGWIFFHRFETVAMEKYIPDSALGYVTINNVPKFLDQFTETKAWQELAPAYGLQKQFGFAGWLGKIARWTGIGNKETLLVARGQFALVVTGIEVRGDEVKPRWALLAETHGSESQVQTLITDRLSLLAKRVYKQPLQESSEYAGVPVTIYRAPQGERQLLSTHIGSEWIVANDPEALRQCVDARQSRITSVAQNSILPEARKAVAADENIFAFINKSGAARLAKFFAHVAAGKVLSGTPVAGLLEGLVEEISDNAIEAIAYSAAFENSGVVERTAILSKPDVATSLQSALRVATPQIWEKSDALKFVPANAESVQIANIEDPNRALDEIEKIISARIGVAQSFLFHRVFTTAKKTFLGIDQNENASQAIGNEVLRFNFPTNDQDDKSDRVWLVEARNKQALTQIATRLISQSNKNSKSEKYQNVELHAAADEKSAFVFLQNILALGSKENLKRLIDALEKKSVFATAAPFTALDRAALPDERVMYGFSSDAAAVKKMMESLQRRTTKAPQPVTQFDKLKPLPLAISFAECNERGVQFESRSAFGNFPLIINFLDSVL